MNFRLSLKASNKEPCFSFNEKDKSDLIFVDYFFKARNGLPKVKKFKRKMGKAAEDVKKAQGAVFFYAEREIIVIS